MSCGFKDDAAPVARGAQGARALSSAKRCNDTRQMTRQLQVDATKRCHNINSKVELDFHPLRFRYSVLGVRHLQPMQPTLRKINMRKLLPQRLREIQLF